MTLHEFTLKAQPLAADEIYLASAADTYGERRATIEKLFTSATLLNCTLNNPTLDAATITGGLTVNTVNKVAITAPATSATLTIANGASLITTGAFATTLAGSANVTLTLPATSATLARTDAAQTFAGTQTFSGTIAGAAITATGLTLAGVITQTSASATAFESGLNGGTNPVFRLVNNIASQATGISITGRAAAAGADITVLSSGTNENLVINAKGSGTITLNPTGTGNIVLSRATTGTSLTLSGAVTAGSAALSSAAITTLTGTNIAVTGGLTTSGNGGEFGYATGAGGAVTQTGSAATAVTLNKSCGQITTYALSTGVGAEEEFTVNNTSVTAGDTIVVSTTYDGAGTPAVVVKAVASLSFKIVITNLHAANALSGALVINFAIVRAVSS